MLAIPRIWIYLSKKCYTLDEHASIRKGISIHPSLRNLELILNCFDKALCCFTHECLSNNGYGVAAECLQTMSFNPHTLFIVHVTMRNNGVGSISTFLQ